MGSGDGQAAARVQKRQSPEDDFRVVIRRERFVYRVRLRVKATASAIEETAHGEQTILGSIGHEVEWRMPTKDNGLVWTSQPVYAEPFLWKENSERLVDTEHC